MPLSSNVNAAPPRAARRRRARPILHTVCAVVLAIVSATTAAEEMLLGKLGVHGPLWITPTEHAACATEAAVMRSEPLLVTGSGFAAKESIQITLVQGETELAVGSVTAAANGLLQASIAIPAAAVTEQKTRVRATAEKGETGEGVVLVSDELVIFAAGDSDADGVDDICDNCVRVANSDLADEDFDGIGDACDKCPTDTENDTDGDGLCADVDPDPYEPQSSAVP
jgi:Thrombospondin type 3 repeat